MAKDSISKKYDVKKIFKQVESEKQALMLAFVFVGSLCETTKARKISTQK